MRHFIAIVQVILLFVFGVVHAAPDVSGSSSSGSSITLTGLGFGTNQAVGTVNLSFTGPNIENGAIGSAFSATSWSIHGGWSTMKYSTDNPISGSQLISTATDAATDGSAEAPYTYTFPTPVGPSGDKLLVSYWLKSTANNPGADGQWKLFRFSTDDSVVDKCTELVLFSWAGQGQLVRCPISEQPIAYPSHLPKWDEVWKRLDMEITTSTSGTGIVKFTTYTPGSAVQVETFSNKSTHASAHNWNYLMFQNYFQDVLGDGTFWEDDMYVQHGSLAHVEVCNESAWSSRKTCFIQEPTAWNDSSVTFTLNAGNFADGSTKYAYVVAPDGSANETGRAITISNSSQTCSTTPSLCEDDASCTSSGWNWCDGACQSSACGTVATCSDGIQNGTETGVDCGGSCAACASTGTHRLTPVTGKTLSPVQGRTMTPVL